VDEAPLPGDVSDSAGLGVHVREGYPNMLETDPAEVLRRGRAELSVEGLLEASGAVVPGLGDVGGGDGEAGMGVDVLQGLPEAGVPRRQEDLLLALSWPLADPLSATFPRRASVGTTARCVRCSLPAEGLGAGAAIDQSVDRSARALEGCPVPRRR
jgi:hypothetical protein